MAYHRGHQPVVIEEFNGLWKRGDADSVPLDHFAECNNIQFIESGFETRDGLDTLLAKGDVLRMYNYKLPDGDSLLILTSDGSIFHALLDGSNTVYGPLLTIATMTDFNFVQFNSFAYITPFTTFTDGLGNDYQKGLENEFVYVYKGDGTNARKAAGDPPTNSDDTPLVAYNSIVDGVIDQGIHVIGVGYIDGGGNRSTAIGTTVRPVIYAPGQKQAILNNIPIGPPGTASREIYMTLAIDPKNWNPDLNSYSYFLALTVADNTTTYAILSIADADLTTPFVAGTFDNPTSGGITAKNNDAEGHCDLGLHVIGVVYETDTGYLTAPGPEVFAVCTFVDGNRSIKVESIPISPDSFVVKRHLVATKAISLYNGDDHGFQLFFIPDGTIDNNTDTERVVSFFDNELVEDASHLLDNFAEIPAGVALGQYHNRMILGTTFDDINIVYASSPGEPEAIDQVDGILGGLPRDGNPITIVQAFRDVLYVFKKNRTYAYSDNDDVPSTWPKPVHIDEGIGCSVHGIGTVLDSGGVNIDFLIITDFSGIFIFNGAYQRPELSWKIQNLWLALDKNRFDEIQTTNDSIQQLLYLNLPSNIILHANYSNGLNPKDIRWAPWTFGIDPTTITLYNNNILALGSKNTIIPTVLVLEPITASPTADDTVFYRLIFSVPVVGVELRNFTLATSGLTGTPEITSLTGSGAHYELGVTTGIGTGTLQVDLSVLNNPDSSYSIQAVSTGKALTVPKNGKPIHVNKTPPVCLSINRLDPTPVTNDIG